MSSSSDGGRRTRLGSDLTPRSRALVVVATGNVGKLAEIRSALPFPGWRFVAASELGDWDPPEETGETFAENALIKARYAAETFGHGGARRRLGPRGGRARRRAGRVLVALRGPLRHGRREQPPLAARARRTCPRASAPRGSAASWSSSTRTAPRWSPTGHAKARSASSRAAKAASATTRCSGPSRRPGAPWRELDLAEKNAISHRGVARLRRAAPRKLRRSGSRLPPELRLATLFDARQALVGPRRESRGRAVAQFGSASALGAEGRGFESRRPDQYAAVVQLVEHQPSKLTVAGSSPVGRSIDIHRAPRVAYRFADTTRAAVLICARSSVG